MKRSLTTGFGIFLTASSIVHVQGFLVPKNRVLSKPFLVGVQHEKPRFALVYGTDGSVSDDDEDRSSFTSTLDPSSSTLPANAIEALSNSLPMPLLTRLGCAFAPPPHNSLHPSKVESASLVSVDSSKLEIAVAVPSEGSLMQVLVPVEFPTPLDTTGDVEANLMEVLQEMDGQSMERIANSERTEDNYEELAHQKRTMESLKEEPSADELPDWWTFANLDMLLEEGCKSMKGLLNEDDFVPDLKALCQANGVSNENVQAAVAAVGPSGLFLRAQVGKNDPVGVSIPFAKKVKAADELREAVLDIVESVEVDEPPVAKETVAGEAKGIEQESTDKFELSAQHALSEEMDGPTMEQIAATRRQPKTPEEEVRLTAKYAAIEDVGERAYAILKDLYMV